MSVDVHTSVFEGPFDLLLHLILRDEVDLYDVSLCTIVDAYLVELGHMENMDLELATEFLLIACTLVELKSRRLLPDETDGDLDEDLALWEERDLLLSRLLECKTFKDASREFERLAAAAGRSVPRCAGLEEAFEGLMPDPLENVGVGDIRAAYLRAIAPKPRQQVSLDHIAPIRLTVADAVGDLATELHRRRRAGFRELTAQLVDRVEVVIYFLAILELYKQGVVELDQLKTFGDITVRWTGGDNEDNLAGAVDIYEG